VLNIYIHVLLKYIFYVLQVILYIQFVQVKFPIKSLYLPIIYTFIYKKYRKIKNLSRK